MIQLYPVDRHLTIIYFLPQEAVYTPTVIFVHIYILKNIFTYFLMRVVPIFFQF